MSKSTFYMNGGENQNGLQSLKINFPLGMEGLFVAALTELQRVFKIVHMSPHRDFYEFVGSSNVHS